MMSSNHCQCCQRLFVPGPCLRRNGDLSAGKDHQSEIGALQIGAPGDVAIMEVVEGPVSIVDTRNNQRDGKAYLKPIQTVINGVPFGRRINRRSRCGGADWLRRSKPAR
jgi:predicted amidohydrolase